MAGKEASFTRKLKGELAGDNTAALCCKRSELAAIIQLRGFINLQEQTLSFIIIIDSNTAVRYLFNLFKEVVMTVPEEIYKEKKPPAVNRYHLVIRDQAAINTILGYLGDGNDADRVKGELPVPGVNYSLLKSECCCRNYLRGAFLAAGSINAPHSGYHLEICAEYEVYGKAILEKMQQFNLKASMRNRRNGYYVYMKQADSIMDFLRIIRAHRALLEMESRRIFKSIRGDTNRKVNFETANLEKASKAAQHQLSLIDAIDGTIGIDSLTVPLREAAQLRRLHPEASFHELGELLEPPVSKSGMGHRFRRIEQIARVTLQRKDKE